MHGQIIVCVRDPSAADSQVIAAVLTEPFVFCTAHCNEEIVLTVCTCFVKSFFCPLSFLSQLALSPAAWSKGRALVRWRRWRRGSKRCSWVFLLFHGIRGQAELLPAGIQEWGGRETYWAFHFLPMPIRCWCHFLVRLTSVDFQAIFRFERIFTLVTLESFLNNNLLNCFFDRNMFPLGGIRSWSFKLFLQKLCPSSCIPPHSRWSFILPLLCFGRQPSLPIGVQVEGEAVPQVQGKGESQRLAGQCLAKVQTLQQNSPCSSFTEVIFTDYFWIRNLSEEH